MQVNLLTFCFLVRHKVKELIEIIQDDQRLREERKKAKKSRDKYKGLSSDEVSIKYDYSKCFKIGLQIEYICT